MKRVLKRLAVASMMLAGILTFSGTAAASSGPAPASDAGFSAASGSQEGGVQMGTQDQKDCWDGKLCFWEGANASGSLYMYPLYPLGRCHNFTTSLNNDTSSMQNTAGRRVRVYRDYDCSGASLDSTDGTYRPTMPSGWNNTISSFKYV